MKSRYRSIDSLQKALANGAFAYATDSKKAAGRALGTFVELITFYLLRSWGLEHHLAIERGLPEFANPSVAHNVEFSLHQSQHLADIPMDGNSTVSAKKLLRTADLLASCGKGRSTSQTLLSADGLLKNACTIFEGQETFVNAYCQLPNQGVPDVASVCKLQQHPFAMFECKRVGVEEGQKKGPQTIEKAKQGAYVARTVSSLQRVRLQDGSIGGFLERPDGSFVCEEYYSLLEKIISRHDQKLLSNFTLTVGVVSNHGNWFTAENKNKEMEVLSQSYDWLLFLTDEGLSTFIEDVLFSHSASLRRCRKAFQDSYSKEKKGNRFTKSRIDSEANAELTAYFSANSRKIASWFNVITPAKSTLTELCNQLHNLISQETQA